MEQLRSPDLKKVDAAVKAIHAIGRPAVQPLLVMLKTAERKTRNHVLSAIGAIGPEAKEAVPTLIRLMRNRSDADILDIEYGVSVQFALIRIGKPAVPALVETLREDRGIGLVDAIIALGDIGPDAAPATAALVSIFRIGGPYHRLKVVQALAKIGPGAEKAVPILLEGISDRDEKVRQASVDALGEVGRGSEVVMPLVDLLSDPDRSTRLLASHAIGKVGIKALPAVKSALRSRDSDVRAGAANAVAVMLQNGLTVGEVEGLIPELIPLLKLSDPWGRSAAAFALGWMKDRGGKAVEPLIAVLDDSDPKVRVSAVEAIGRIGEPARSAIPKLKVLVKDPDEKVRDASVKALKLLETPKQP